MQASTNNYQFLKINDKGTMVQIKQPSLNELASLYYVLLGNLEKINKNRKA